MSTYNKPSKTYAQVMLAIVLINFPLCFLLWGLLLLIPIGAWQVIDALVRVIQGDQRRLPYLYAVLGYFVLVGLIVSLSNEISNSKAFLVGGFAVPYLIAFWYVYLTWAHAVEPEEEPDVLDNLIDFEEEGR